MFPLDYLQFCPGSAMRGGTSYTLPISMTGTRGFGYGTWRVDFTVKRLDNGKQFTCCMFIDLESRLCLSIDIKSRFTTDDLIRTFGRLIEEHGRPEMLVLSNQRHPDLRGLADFALEKGVEVYYDAPQRPTPSGMKMPTGERWSSLDQARRTVERWRRTFNRSDATRH